MAAHVAFTWKLDQNLESNAACDYTPPLIRYKASADELIDIAHELLHFEMIFMRKLPRMGYSNNDAAAVASIVTHLNNMVEDTYIFYRLFNDFTVFPISPTFFEVCKKDIKSGTIGQTNGQSEPVNGMIAAWRIRLAQLASGAFNSLAAADNKNVADEFLDLFSKRYSTAMPYLEVLENENEYAKSGSDAEFLKLYTKLTSLTGSSKDRIHPVRMRAGYGWERM